MVASRLARLVRGLAGLTERISERASLGETSLGSLGWGDRYPADVDLCGLQRYQNKKVLCL